MCYDTRSQIFDQCIASANAPISICQKGISDYIQIKVPPEKLILGVPWYGYKYECIDPDFNPESGKTCEISQVPFRGVNCSDAAGSEVAYANIRSIVNEGRNSSSVMRDNYMNVPFFNYRDDGKNYQIWYDDPESLSAIYKWAVESGLGGTGEKKLKIAERGTFWRSFACKA
jgi:Di-N-acetylchitobiase